MVQSLGSRSSVFAHAKIKALSLSLSLSTITPWRGPWRVDKEEGTRGPLFIIPSLDRRLFDVGALAKGQQRPARFLNIGETHVAGSCARETLTNRTSPTWISIYIHPCFFVLSNTAALLDTIRDYISQSFTTL